MKKNHITFSAWIILITLLGAVIRFYSLGQVPVSLYWDEAAMLVDAKAVTETGHDMHGRPWYQVMYPSYGDYKLPVYIWLASLSVKLFGVSEWALRLPAAVVGTAQIPLIAWLTYSLMKLVTKKADRSQLPQWAAIIASVLFAFSPWSILFSRTGFEGFVGQFLLTLSITSLLNSKLKPVSILLSIGLGALAVYTYFSVRYVWPVVFIASLALASWYEADLKARSRQWLTRVISIAILGFIGWSLLLWPLFRSPLYEPSQQFRLSAASLLSTDQFVIQSNILREQAGNTLASRVVYHRYLLLGKAFAANIFSHLDPRYLFVTGDSNLRHGTGTSGLFVGVLLLPLVAGILWLWKKALPLGLFLLLWWVTALVPASVPLDVPHALRSLNALSPAIVLLSLGSAVLLHELPKRVQLLKVGKLITMALFAVFVTQTVLFLHDYFVHYPVRSAYDWQDGYRQLSEIITQQRAAVRTVWVNPDDNRLYLWLMIYGDVPAVEFAQLPYQGFQLKELANVRFEGYHWANLETLDHKILVVDRPGQLQGEPNWQQDIIDRSGATRFVVAEYGR